MERNQKVSKPIHTHYYHIFYIVRTRRPESLINPLTLVFHKTCVPIDLNKFSFNPDLFFSLLYVPNENLIFYVCKTYVLLKLNRSVFRVLFLSEYRKRSRIRLSKKNFARITLNKKTHPEFKLYKRV